MGLIRIIKIFAAITIMLIGSLFAFIIPNVIVESNEKCTYETSGVVIDYAEDDENENYSPIYEFEMNGEKYTAHTSTYSNMPPDLGTVNTIMVQPDNPKHIYVPGSDDILITVFRIIGYIVLGAGVITLLFPLKLIFGEAQKGSY